MDLSTIDLEKRSNEGGEMELLHPTNFEVLKHNDTPIVFKLLGRDSAKYRNTQRKIQAKRVKELAKARPGADAPITSDEDVCKLLSACTIGWNGIVENGVEIEFSEDAAYDLYMRHIWIREQVDAFVGTRSNFLSA